MKRKKVTRSLVAWLTAGVALPTAMIVWPIEAGFNESVDSVNKGTVWSIDEGRIYNHIDMLSQEPRVAGTEIENEAIDYLRDEFESYGYEVEVQPFTYTGYTEPKKIVLTVSGMDKFDPVNFTYGVSGDVKARLVDAGIGTSDTFKKLSASGKIAVIRRGEISFSEKVLNASQAGASGVILINNEPGSLNGTFGGQDDRLIPALSLTQKQGEALLERMAEDPHTEARVVIEGASTAEHISHNVVATKHATNGKKGTDEVMMITSHIDSVPGAPGANDNASGAAMTLELARVFKDLPTDTEIRFASFGAEELGLIGSRHYVGALSQPEKDRIIASFNLDMVGSKDSGDLMIATVDGEPNLVTELVQKASEKLNGTPTARGESGSSDHVPFYDAGIPSALFIHTPHEPWYHSPQDSVDKISKEKLEDVAEIVADAVYSRARFDDYSKKK